MTTYRASSAGLLAVQERRVDLSVSPFGLVDLHHDTVERSAGEVDDHHVRAPAGTPELAPFTDAITYLDEGERAGDLLVLDLGRQLVHGSYDEVRAGFTGVITRTTDPVRPGWSWRRGRDRHEYWPDGPPDASAPCVDPDLEDIVIALSIRRRDTAPTPGSGRS